jgi:hypothetical protein
MRADWQGQEVLVMDGQDLPEAAAAAVARIGRDFGAEVVPPGADPAQLLAPAAALRVARQVELAARAEVGSQIRRAREDGMSWHEVGALLDFAPLAAHSRTSVAQYAFDYCVGPCPAAPWFDPPAFAWTCPACGQMICDRGPVLIPAADEKDHADGCRRLAAAQAEWMNSGA